MREEGKGIGVPTSLPVATIYVGFWRLPRLSHLNFTRPPKQDMKCVPVLGTKAKQKTSANQIHPFTRYLSCHALLPR